jgi:GT2 family glycosyltransferase
MTKIAVAILNWNGEELLRRFLKSIVENSPDDSIYLIDNASNDGSVTFVKNSFPAVNIIQLDKNYGYAGGYNKGLIGIKEDILCLINNDVFVPEGWLTPFKNHFKKNPHTAIAQPHVMDLNQPGLFEYAGAAGGYIDRLGYPYCRGRVFHHLEKDRGQYDFDQKVFWASGACFFIRKNVFNSLGGFDEDFFAHMEEIDLCWRAQNENHDIYSLYQTKVQHQGGGTLKISPKKTFYNFRNSLYLLVKNLPEKRNQRILERLFMDGIAVLFFILQLKILSAFAVIKAHFCFYKHVSVMIRKRTEKADRAHYYTETHLPFRFFLTNKKIL